MKEKVEYEHTPNPEDETAWDIRILSGDFVETVIRFGVLEFDEENEAIKYNFEVISSPDFDAVPENKDLQMVAGNILYSIMGEGTWGINESN